jgi:hypothetical protein
MMSANNGGNAIFLFFIFGAKLRQTVIAAAEQ